MIVFLFASESKCITKKFIENCKYEEIVLLLQTDAEAFIALVKEVNASSPAKQDELNEDLLRNFAFNAMGDIPPMQAVIGGITAQEVMMACSGKFTPVNQWLYYDALECLPNNADEVLTEETCKPVKSRYDGQRAVFGEAFQTKLGNLKYFLVSKMISCRRVYRAIVCKICKFCKFIMFNLSLPHSVCILVKLFLNIRKL